MEIATSNVTTRPERVVVFHNDDLEGVPQPGSFSCFANGVQLYSRKELPLYELLEFTLEIPPQATGPSRRITCICMVVGCTYETEAALFQVNVQFLDLPQAARQNLSGLIQA